MKIRLFILLFFGTVGLVKAQQPFTIGETQTIYSKILGEERILNIYLPAYYSDTISYPVIYLLDGSADEDFVHVSGVMQFMNMMQIIPDAIIVGIANVDRKRDFCFPTTIEQDKKDFPTTGGSEKFIQFVESELQPFIENNYPVNKNKTIIGQSLGGLVATEILFKKPTLFNNYIIVSPSLWWDNESLLNIADSAMANLPAGDMQIYLAVGKEHPTMVKDAKKLHKILKHSGKKNLEIHFEQLKKEDLSPYIEKIAAFKNKYVKIVEGTKTEKDLVLPFNQDELQEGEKKK